MSKPTKGFLLTGLAIVVISVAPMIVTLIAAAIAGVLGCPLDEGSVHSCVVLAWTSAVLSTPWASSPGS
jgi:hypothetical protein